MKAAASGPRRAIYTQPQVGTLTGEVRLDTYDNVEYFYADEKHWPKLERLGYDPEAGNGLFLDAPGAQIQYI